MPETADFVAYRQRSGVIDWAHPAVLNLARGLSAGLHNPTAVAKRCFEWVRDDILHTADHGLFMKLLDAERW